MIVQALGPSSEAAGMPDGRLGRIASMQLLPSHAIDGSCRVRRSSHVADLKSGERERERDRARAQSLQIRFLGRSSPTGHWVSPPVGSVLLYPNTLVLVNDLVHTRAVLLKLCSSPRADFGPLRRKVSAMSAWFARQSMSDGSGVFSPLALVSSTPRSYHLKPHRQ